MLRVVAALNEGHQRSIGPVQRASRMTERGTSREMAGNERFDVTRSQPVVCVEADDRVESGFDCRFARDPARSIAEVAGRARESQVSNRPLIELGARVSVGDQNVFAANGLLPDASMAPLEDGRGSRKYGVSTAMRKGSASGGRRRLAPGASCGSPREMKACNRRRRPAASSGRVAQYRSRSRNSASAIAPVGSPATCRDSQAPCPSESSKS